MDDRIPRMPMTTYQLFRQRDLLELHVMDTGAGAGGQQGGDEGRLHDDKGLVLSLGTDGNREECNKGRSGRESRCGSEGQLGGWVGYRMSSMDSTSFRRHAPA